MSVVESKIHTSIQHTICEGLNSFQHTDCSHVRCQHAACQDAAVKVTVVLLCLVPRGSLFGRLHTHHLLHMPCSMLCAHHAAISLVQVALRAIVGSIAHDDSLVTEVRQAFEELEHGHAGSVKNSILLQVLPCLALPCLALPCRSSTPTMSCHHRQLLGSYCL